MTSGTGPLGAWRLGAAVAATVAIIAVLSISTANGTARQSENVASPEALAEAVRAVVGLRAEIPADARTAASLGTERSGNGVLIDSKGLVLTIGYLILEATAVEVFEPGGRVVAASIIGYDHDTGLGLVRALEPLAAKPLRLGAASELTQGDAVLAASFGGPRPLSPAYVASRRAFAGYWEYLLEDAIFTVPPHPMFGGAALIGADGRLVGIGSLAVGDAAAPGLHSPGNMFVPIDGLKPILGDLLAHGQPSTSHPWLGAFTAETKGRVFITRVAADGPAEEAGLKTGDIIMGIGGKRVKDMADYFRKMWAQGAAGVEIPVNIMRAGDTKMSIETVVVRSRNRYDWLKLRTRGY
ncbi:MAG: S1C family serine protease [Rhodospirillales bacterium]|jgi:S1-C subfamily serine protease|nr:S1C family serine protease [Rhodospirillales bacterium]MDP6772748.1 S1C family serine protease [Rhodospirillales bacterium]